MTYHHAAEVIREVSALDEGGTVAVSLACHALARGKKKGFFVADDCHPQTIAVIETRCEPLGVEVHIGPRDSIDPEGSDEPPLPDEASAAVASAAGARTVPVSAGPGQVLRIPPLEG